MREISTSTQVNQFTQANGAVTEHKSLIDNHIKSLMQLNAVLLTRLSFLEERLVSVLYPSIPVSAGNEKPSNPKPITSPMVSALEHFEAETNQAIAAIDDLINRLET